jgi:hypothetical protein
MKIQNLQIHAKILLLKNKQMTNNNFVDHLFWKNQNAIIGWLIDKPYMEYLSLV